MPSRSRARIVYDGELANYGICIVEEHSEVRFRVREFGDVVLLAGKGDSGEIVLDTRSTYPKHAFVAFIDWSTMPPQADERSRSVPGGAIAIAPQGLVRRIRFNGAWQLVAAFVPQTSAMDVPPDALAGTIFRDRRMLGTSMLCFIAGLLDVDQVTSTVEEGFIENLVSEMARGLLMDRFSGAVSQRSRAAALRDKARLVIARRCGDRSLTPSEVAREVHVSLRQLQFVFAPTGMGIAGEIRLQRARLAHSVLTDRRYLRLSVEEIAQRAGFQSTVTLRRALDVTYGATPSSLRKLAR